MVTFWKDLHPREKTIRFIQEYWIRVIWSVMCRFRKPEHKTQQHRCHKTLLRLRPMLTVMLNVQLLIRMLQSHFFGNYANFLSMPDLKAAMFAHSVLSGRWL